ncbi:hypothetical protein IC575_005616 [Cucumis melo]|uniref:non-specific serine/threonine protein kinase n=2 Tax=Cucumis melo TaxID=3656 RepID=A0A9I9CU34_CUCME
MSMNSSLPIIILIFLFLSHFPFLSLSFLMNQNITLSGDAHLRNNAIFLTQERDCLSLSPNSSSSASGFGSAVYVNPVRFLDSSTNSSASFSSRFSLSILPTPLCPFPDGFSFLIASDPESFTLSNSHIPLPNPSHNSPFSFIAVEFDTNFDSNLGDINDNHLGLNVNSPTSLTSVDFRSHGIILKNGRKITSWIEYRDDSKTIRVWVGYSQTRPVNPLLVAPMDLSKQFKEFMYVGFSASNGQGSALFIVDRWQFRTFGLVPSLSPVDTINEGACFMCSSEDLNSDNSRFADADERRKKSGEMSLLFGGLAAFAFSGALILGFLSYALIKKLRSRMCRGREIDRTCPVEMNRVPTRLSLGAIKLATMGFNQNRVVGEGGSATVYKGSLPSGVEVAVKRFEQSTVNNRLRNPFRTEFATMVGCLRHKNLVQLHGWCCEANELVLVYEYLANGSLANLLHETSPNSQFVIPWKKRVSIVLGVASALTYLHEECESQIIHRDVKTCNILLDAELNAKLGDFGLAEVYEHSSSLTRIATTPAGTMGYLAPEYLYSGVPTVKTDVYSFGVVMLEVASGKRPVDEGGLVLVDWIWILWGGKSVMEAADPSLMGNYDVVEMERMLTVGLFCVHPNAEKRPNVREAVRILKGEAPLPVLPLKKPMVGIRRILSDDFEDLENPCEDYIAFEEPAWMTPKSEFG